MKTYELDYLISPNLTEAEIKNFQEKIVSLVQEKGILIDARLPRKIVLSYPIKKNNYAFFATLNFQMKPESLAELEKKMKSESCLIRYLILTKTASKSIGVRRKARIVSKKFETSEKEKVKIEEIEEKLEEVLGESEKI